MITDTSTKVARVGGWLTLLARWTLGVLYIYMGLSKAFHPVEFLKIIRQYDMVHHHLALNFVAGLLPWFEVFCGVLLLAGIAVRGTALVSLLMLVTFTWAVIARAWQIHTLQSLPFCAIRFDCGCGAGEILICKKIAENTALMLASVWLATKSSRQFALRFSLNESRVENRVVTSPPL